MDAGFAALKETCLRELNARGSQNWGYLDPSNGKSVFLHADNECYVVAPRTNEVFISYLQIEVSHRLFSPVLVTDKNR